MSLRVGQGQGGAIAALRAAAVNHASSPSSARGVDGLAAATSAGPQEHSLRFHDTWEEMTGKGSKRRRGPLGMNGGAVRFGTILAEGATADALFRYRSEFPPTGMQSLQVGAMIYDRANAAIQTGGYASLTGGTLNRLL